jgi:hypothetical protein
MPTIKLHNPELAKGSVFKNLVLEQISGDNDLVDGKLWIDVDNKKVKFAIKNGDTLVAEHLALNKDLLDTIQALNEEVNRAKNAENTLQTNIDNEVQRAKDAETQIQNALNEEVTRAKSIEGDLNFDDSLDTITTDENGNEVVVKPKSITEAVNAEVSRAKASESAISTALNNEVQRAKDAENTLQTNIDNLSNDVNANYLNKTSTEAQSVKAPVTFDNNIVIKGDLVVEGSKTEIETEVLKVKDNIITLNDGVASDAEPTANAGFEVNRGKEGTLTFIEWDETDDKVKFYDGSELDEIRSEEHV